MDRRYTPPKLACVASVSNRVITRKLDEPREETLATQATPKRVTSPTWGPPPPYRQALTLTVDVIISSNTKLRLFEIHELCVIRIRREEKGRRSVFQITCV